MATDRARINLQDEEKVAAQRAEPLAAHMARTPTRPVLPQVAATIVSLQRTAGNQAVQRLLTASGGLVQRMTIKGLNKTPKKNIYKPGDRPRFLLDYKRAKDNRSIDYAALGTNEKSFKYVFDVLAEQEVEFADVDEFINEITSLIQGWGGQKFFYEKPKKGIVEVLPDMTGQLENRTIKLYSARSADMVQNLFIWATQQGVPLEGFDSNFQVPEGQGPVTAPMKGHFGDRSHTVKHHRQKAAQGARLISINLTEEGSEALRKRKENPEHVALEGEGYEAGQFGIKTEKTYVSVALSDAGATWEYLKPFI